MKVEIDQQSGFCYGVIKAIEKAEKFLKSENQLFCLGDIVHNEAEIKRLNDLGMTSITIDETQNINAKTVLFRAHGEPPSSYQKLNKQSIRIIDATCPVVLKLQERIRKAYTELKKIKGQLVIYGKKGHPEVIGLVGQVNGDAFIVETEQDIDKLDMTNPIEIFSQTTKSVSGFNSIVNTIKQKHTNPTLVLSHDTICRQVSNRIPHLKEFANQYEVIVFVGGTNSSNGKILFDVCKKENHNSYFISDVKELDNNWFKSIQSVGICGATSTPRWQLNQVYNAILKNTKKLI
ncbi:MAG: 4-hydroxy-3-methylbut-2-enyl diphosphate reductase [Marinilabiliaceae bacterium]|nr:4-hydroxy-3-methylbut-2-enyl diphosphate reductase [Marinilabiliaceae bacterium]